MSDIKSDLTNQLILIRAEEERVREQIRIIDFEETKDKLQKFVGKCYRQKEIGGYEENHFSCCLVYGIDENRQDLKTLVISYWKEQETYFQIDYSTLFNPLKFEFYKEDPNKYEEISRPEFNDHYQEVRKRIENALK